ncbi:MAG: O-antigen/teichoic acid export membrane protein [Granulosicoccus sp.]|jgi:O-antigen/teichoic acid export membrane protein
MVFIKNSYRRNIAVLASGTAVAQVVPIVASPLLTRLYTPEEFGLLALYMAITSILTVVATGKYELAVTLPTQDIDAWRVVKLLLTLGLSVGGLLLLVMSLYFREIAQLLGNSEIAPFLFLLPLSVCATTAMLAYQFWCNRQSLYKEMVRSRLHVAVGGVVAKIVLGMFKVPGGQIIGTVLSQLVSVAIFRTRIVAQTNVPKGLVRLPEQWQMAKHYVVHPLYFLPSYLCSSVALQIPIFMMSSLFSLSIVGFFSIAYRLVTLPTKLVANAIGDVYRQQISSAYNEKAEFSAIFLKTIRMTTLISVLPFLVLYFAAPRLFEFVLGQGWGVAGDYAQILVVSTFLQFIFTPLDKGAIVVGAKKYVLFWNIARLLSFIALWVCASQLNWTIEQILWGFVAINGTLYCIDGVFQYRFSKGIQYIR